MLPPQRPRRQPHHRPLRATRCDRPRCDKHLGALPRALAIENGAIGAEGRGAERFAVVGGSGTIQLPPEILASYPSGTLLSVELDGDGIVLRARTDSSREDGNG